MKFLIAGYGSIGRRHFQNLKKLGETDIVFFRTSKSTLPDDELNGFVVESDLKAALAQRPDALIVANPTALHLGVAVPAAQACCDLLLEKPISNSMDGVDRLNSAVRQSGSRVEVGFQFRFHPGLIKAKELLDSGELGEPASARVFWGEYLPDWHPWEDYRKSYSARTDLGGGVVLTLSHPFDYLRWLLGEVKSVTGHVQRSGTLDLDVEDVADINLELEKYIQASLHLDYLQKPPTHSLEVECTEGKIHWDALSGLLRVTNNKSEDQYFPVPVGFERNDLFLAEMAHFIRVVKGEVAPICTLEDGVKALQIALAVHASSAEGKSIQLI